MATFAARVTSRHKDAKFDAYAVAAVICLPLFLSVHNGIVLAPQYGSNSDLSSSVLPLSAFASLALLVLGMCRAASTLVFRATDLLLVAYGLVLTISLWFGISVSKNPAGTLINWGQTVYPLIWFFIARAIVSRGNPLYRLTCFWKAVCGVLLASVALYVLQTVVDGTNVFRFSLLADHIGPFYNYKFKRFYPLFLAVSSTAALNYFLYSTARFAIRYSAVMASFLALAAIVLTHSRTALLAWVIGFGLAMGPIFWRASGRFVRRAAVINVLILTAILIGVGTIGYEGMRSLERLLGTLEQLSSSQELESGDETRLRRWAAGVDYGVLRPLGDMYSSEPKHQLGSIEARQVGGHDVLETESGFLDIAVRAGPVAMGLIMIVIGRVLLIWHRLWRQQEEIWPAYRWTVGATWCASIQIFVIGMTFLDLAAEPYFAPFFWFLVGSADVVGQLGLKKGLMIS